MSRTPAHPLTRFGAAIATCLVGAAALLLGPPQSAQAANMSYELTICEDLNVLANPSDMMAQMMAAWKTQTELLVARNQPYVELRNTSDTATITHFRLTIGDLAQNFDFAQFVASSSPGVSMSVVSPDGVQNGARGDFVDLAITGLTPGKFLRFRLDIDPDAANAPAYSDYRTVMFDMNGSNSADNSRATVTFHDPPSADVLQNDFLPDFAMTMSTVVGVQFRTPYSMDHVVPFSITGLAPGPVVPEPSSAALLGAGLGIGLVGAAWRRRRQRIA